MSKFFKSFLLLLSAGVFATTGWAVLPEPWAAWDPIATGNPTKYSVQNGITPVPSSGNPWKMERGNNNNAYTQGVSLSSTVGVYAPYIDFNTHVNFSHTENPITVVTTINLNATEQSNTRKPLIVFAGWNDAPQGLALTLDSLTDEGAIFGFARAAGSQFSSVTDDTKTLKVQTIKPGQDVTIALFLSSEGAQLYTVADSGSTHVGTWEDQTFNNLKACRVTFGGAHNASATVSFTLKNFAIYRNTDAETPLDFTPATMTNASISGETNALDITWDPSEPTAQMDATLTVAADSKLTMNKSITAHALTIEGSGPFTIAATDSNKLTATTTTINTDTTVEVGAASLGAVTIDADKTLTVKDNATVDSVVGGTLAIDATAEDVVFTTDTALTREEIRQYTGKIHVKGAGENGIALEYAGAQASEFGPNLILDGGTHTFYYQRANGQLFASGDSNDNPTIWVKNNAKLTFRSHDLSGWQGGVNVTGVIRVDNGSTLNFTNNENSTSYYRQRLYLEPGATMTIADAFNKNFRLQGGVATAETAQLYVPGVEADAEVKVATISGGKITFAKDDTNGLGFNVGANATLAIHSPFDYDTDDGKASPIAKYGEGTLLLKGGYAPTGNITINAGTLALGFTGALTNAITNNATLAVDGENVVMNLTGATLSGSGTYVARNGAILKLTLDQVTNNTVAADGGTVYVVLDASQQESEQTVAVSVSNNGVYQFVDANDNPLSRPNTNYVPSNDCTYDVAEGTWDNEPRDFDSVVIAFSETAGEVDLSAILGDVTALSKLTITGSNGGTITNVADVATCTAIVLETVTTMPAELAALADTIEATASLSIVGGTETVDVSGVISGAGQVKIVSGEVTFSGANTYTGGTDIAADATLTMGNANAIGTTGNITGAGTLKFSGFVPANLSNLTVAEGGWTGTFYMMNRLSAAQFPVNDWGNANSTICFENCSGYLTPAGGTTIVSNFRVEGNGWRSQNGNGNAQFTFTGALSGSGKLEVATATPEAGNFYKFTGDVSDFTGYVNVTNNHRVVFGDANSQGNGKITIAKPVAIAAGKTWTAVNGITVTEAATLSGTGTIASALTYSSTAASTFGGSITGDLTVASGTLELTAFQYDENAGRTIGNLAVDGGTLRINAPSDLSNEQRFVEDRKSIAVAANAILELNSGYAYLSATGDGLTKVTGNFVLGVTGASGLNNVTTHLEVVDGATLSLRNWRADDYALTPASLKLNGTMGLNQSGNSKNTYVVNTRAISGKGSLASGVTLALPENATIDVTDGVVIAGTVTLAGAVTVTGSVEDGDYILKCTNATAEDAAKITVEGFAVTADATGYKAVAVVVDASLETTFTAADQTLTWSELVGVNAEKLYQGGTLTITFTAEGQTFTFDKDAALAFSQITINGDYAGTLAKTGTATVSATATAIDTDTTVEAGVASLGTVTIADDKTLTVKDVNTVSSLSGQGVYNLDLGETTADAYTIAADGKNYKVSSGTFTNATLNFSATQTNYEFAGGDLTLTGNEGQFSFGTADVTISGGTIRATHLITVQDGNNRLTTIEQTGGNIILSGTGDGSDSPMNKQTVMFGHWRNGSSTYTLSGGSLVAENGGVRFGHDSQSTMTISGTGLFKVKGIKGQGTTASALTITGGKLSLGDWGFDAINSFTFTAQGGEINAFGNATINQAITLNGNVTLSADAEKTLTIYAITGTGSLTIAGEGTVALPDAVVETIPVTVAEGATLKVIPTVDEAVLGGEIILAEGSVVNGTLTVDGVEEFTRDGTTITFTPDATITGLAWWWDYEFNGNGNNIGSEASALSWDGDRPYQNAEYTEPVEGDTNQMLKLPARPWRNVSIWPAEATFVMYAKAGTNADSVLASFGSSTHGSSKAITLMTGTNPENGDMRLVYTEGTAAENVVDLVENLSVPNATTSYHLYAFVLETVDEKTHVSVYVDGGLVATYTADSIIQLGGGFQIASVHGGCPSGLNRLANEDTATMDFLRVSNTVLSSEAMKALANAYPYTSPNGTATRTVESTDEVKAWIGAEGQTVWTQTTLADDGSGATTDEAQVAPTAGSVVKVTVIDETSVALNIPAEGVSYEKLEFFGDGELTLTAVENAGLMTIAGMTSISANATITAGAVKVGAVDVATDKILTFDYSAYDFSDIWALTTIPLTGLATGEGTVAVTFPATKPAQITTWECVKDANTQSYALKITVDSSALTGVISGDCTWDEISEWTIGEVAVSKPSDWSLVQAVTLSGTGTVTLPEGGIDPDTLKIDGAITLALPGETTATIPSLVIGAGANVTIPQALTVTEMEIGEGATIGYAATSEMEIAEPLTGNYNLTVVSGTVKLTGESANAAYTGTITVKNGATLVLGYGVGLPATAPIALEDGATLFAKNGVGTSSTIASAITIDGAVTIKGSENGNNTCFTGAISGTGTLTIASGDYDNTFAIDGAITGALKVVVNIDDGVTFSGVNAFTGGLEIVEGGKLTVTHPGAMGTKGTKSVVNNGALTFAFPVEGEGSSDEYVDVFSGAGDYTLASGSLTWKLSEKTTIGALNVTGGVLTVDMTVSQTTLDITKNSSITNGTLLVVSSDESATRTGISMGQNVTLTVDENAKLAFSGNGPCLRREADAEQKVVVESTAVVYGGGGIEADVELKDGATLDLYGYNVANSTGMPLKIGGQLTLPSDNGSVTVKTPLSLYKFLIHKGAAIPDWMSRFTFTNAEEEAYTLEENTLVGDTCYLYETFLLNEYAYGFASVQSDPNDPISPAAATDIASLVLGYLGGGANSPEVHGVTNPDVAECFEGFAIDLGDNWENMGDLVDNQIVTLSYDFGVSDITVAKKTVGETWIAVAVKVTNGGGVGGVQPPALRSGTQIHLSKDDGVSYEDYEEKTALTPAELAAAGLKNGDGVYWYWAEELPEIDSQATSTTVKYKVKAVNNGATPTQQ